MNAKLAGEHSWEDIWPTSPAEAADLRTRDPQARMLNLTSISIGNGWVNSRVQYRALIDFACGGAAERDVPLRADVQDCEWARQRVLEGEALMDNCTSVAGWSV